MRAPRAPVTLGALDGNPASVRSANHANAMA
jgi:hypothetical protein